MRLLVGCGALPGQGCSQSFELRARSSRTEFPLPPLAAAPRGRRQRGSGNPYLAPRRAAAERWETEARARPEEGRGQPASAPAAGAHPPFGRPRRVHRSRSLGRRSQKPLACVCRPVGTLRLCPGKRHCRVTFMRAGRKETSALVERSSEGDFVAACNTVRQNKPADQTAGKILDSFPRYLSTSAVILQHFLSWVEKANHAHLEVTKEAFCESLSSHRCRHRTRFYTSGLQPARLVHKVSGSRRTGY